MHPGHAAEFPRSGVRHAERLYGLRTDGLQSQKRSERAARGQALVEIGLR